MAGVPRAQDPSETVVLVALVALAADLGTVSAGRMASAIPRGDVTGGMAIALAIVNAVSALAATVIRVARAVRIVPVATTDVRVEMAESQIVTPVRVTTATSVPAAIADTAVDATAHRRGAMAVRDLAETAVVERSGRSAPVERHLGVRSVRARPELGTAPRVVMVILAVVDRAGLIAAADRAAQAGVTVTAGSVRVVKVTVSVPIGRALTATRVRSVTAVSAATVTRVRAAMVNSAATARAGSAAAAVTEVPAAVTATEVSVRVGMAKATARIAHVQTVTRALVAMATSAAAATVAPVVEVSVTVGSARVAMTTSDCGPVRVARRAATARRPLRNGTRPLNSSARQSCARCVLDTTTRRFRTR